jgi:hypothetical protein
MNYAKHVMYLNTGILKVKWHVFFRVVVNDKDIKVNIFDMAGHPVFYEVRVYSWVLIYL